jgi:ABC-type transport system substrate-binding protein
VRRRAPWAGSALAVAITVLASACTGGAKPQPSAPATNPIPTGGTLRVGVLIDGGVGRCDMTFCGGQVNDPQINGIVGPTYELLRCCLLRTLLSYNGQSTSGGGTLLRPDLAAALPEVSADGLTWTFHLRAGLHYAPPLQSTEITAGDFIRSVERLMGAPSGGSTPGVRRAARHLSGRIPRADQHHRRGQRLRERAQRGLRSAAVVR